MNKRDPNRAEIERLLRNLGSKDDAVRYQAYAEAQCLPAEQLLELVNAEARQLSRHKVKSSIGCLISVSGFILFLLLGRFSVLVAMVLYGLLLAAGFILLVDTGPYERLERFRKVVSGLLRDRQDVRFTRTALLLWADSMREYRPNVSQALQSLLPQLRAGNTADWSEEEQTALLEPLQNWHKDVDLTLCVLKALEQVGDENAVEPMQMLAQMPIKPSLFYSLAYDREDIRDAINRGGDDASLGRLVREEVVRLEENAWKVKQTAAEGLEFLLARLAAKHQEQTLLRAVETVSTPETLLRPVGTSREETPEQLLRPKE